MPASLFIVATPIGHLDDMTLRAIEILKSVDLIAAEDTRHSAKLLKHYDIRTPLVSYHDYSDANDVDELMARLRSGASIALISDAGTPVKSDTTAAALRGGNSSANRSSQVQASAGISAFP